MSDIPIGTPPSPPGRHAAPGGWYPDPIDARQERYWDGWQWSRTTRPRATPPPDQQVLQDYQSPPGYQNPPEYQNPQGYQNPPEYQNPQGYGTQQPSSQPPYAGQPSPQGQQPYGSQPHQTAPYRPAPLGGSAQAAYTADGVPLSGWWWRVLAVCLDSIFVSLLVAIPAFGIYRRMIDAISVYFAEALRAAQSGQPAPDITAFVSNSDQVRLLAMQISIALLYQIVFLRFRSATPGKMICRLRVVPVDRGQSSEPLAWSSVVVRALVWVLPGISVYLLIFRLIDVLFPLWQPKRQALHDLAARTQVIRRV